ncbi:MAG: decarboxylating 6-phosphogluconate dehydrogenase [Deltaproteobacteria bacterium]|nr:decarboxylating 6-phosphogluconate dehydrogenase [Deltaproteobacteria bacterium]
MELGMIGLGRMGASMVERLLRAGHRVVVHDMNPAAVAKVVCQGAVGALNHPRLCAELAPPRAIWLMVPAGEPVDQTIQSLMPQLRPDDTILDGGNSNYKDSLRRAAALNAKQLHFVDVGTSGGIWGLTEGYSLMVGGETQVVERLKPVFQALAPAPDKGWGHVGPNGAGHFAKMVHNGIEYGLMQAYAEGFALMRRKIEFQLNLHQIAEIWRDGSVVRSWLLDLISKALRENPDLTGIQPYVDDSGEGRWTVFESIDLDVSAPVITLSLLERLRSRDRESFAAQLLAMMRHQFGGHPLKKEG